MGSSLIKQASGAIYPEGNYPEIIPNYQSANHNSVLGGIHGLESGKHGNATNNCTMKRPRMSGTVRYTVIRYLHHFPNYNDNYFLRLRMLS